MRVEITVPKIIDGAAGAAHDNRTRVEEKACPNYSRHRRDWTGERGGQDCAEHTREEEVVCADWLIETDKFSVWDP